MSKIVKPDLTYQWASAAGGGSVAPSSGKIQTGHIVEKPNYEYMNWLQNRQDTSIAYTFQMGVPEWDSLVEYQYHANYKSYVQRNGLVYKALQVGTNKDPASEAAYWALAFDNYGSAATVQSNLTTHITDYGTLASLSNAATARTNLDVYSKGEGDARYAALGGLNSQLFLVANGTTGYEAVNKSQLDTKAPTAGNAAQEFAVAAATTGNNAVNLTQLIWSVSSGMVLPFAGSAAPIGWLECNGGAVSRTTYAPLFAVIDTLWGIGDGSTTFNLPDLRGEFVRGFDNGRGVDSGRAICSFQTDEIKAHTHDYFLWSPGGGGYGDGMSNDTIADNRPATPTTSTGGSETRPRNVAMMYIIKI